MQVSLTPSHVHVQVQQQQDGDWDRRLQSLEQKSQSLVCLYSSSHKEQKLVLYSYIPLCAGYSKVCV